MTWKDSNPKYKYLHKLGSDKNADIFHKTSSKQRNMLRNGPKCWFLWAGCWRTLEIFCRFYIILYRFSGIFKVSTTLKPLSCSKVEQWGDSGVRGVLPLRWNRIWHSNPLFKRARCIRSRPNSHVQGKVQGLYSSWPAFSSKSVKYLSWPNFTKLGPKTRIGAISS